MLVRWLLKVWEASWAFVEVPLSLFGPLEGVFGASWGLAAKRRLVDLLGGFRGLLGALENNQTDGCLRPRASFTCNTTCKLHVGRLSVPAGGLSTRLTHVHRVAAFLERQ